MPLFTHKCSVQRHNGATNYLNEPDPTGWQVQQTAVPCRFKDNIQREPEAQSAGILLSPYLLIVQTGTDVLPTDRITDIITPDGVEAGPFRVAEGPYKRRDGRGATRHLSLGLEKTEADYVG
jgi:hypothetical protein